MLTPDLILPWTLICDECMEGLVALEGEALKAYLAAAYLAEDAAESRKPVASTARGHPFEKQIIAHVQRVKENRD
jgi:hypothetical protein